MIDDPEVPETQSLSLRAWSTRDPKPKGGNARMWTTARDPKPVKKKPKKRTRKG